MKKLLNLLKKESARKKRREGLAENNWMRGQLSRMQKMNQGIISMSGGK